MTSYDSSNIVTNYDCRNTSRGMTTSKHYYRQTNKGVNYRSKDVTQTPESVTLKAKGYSQLLLLLCCFPPPPHPPHPPFPAPPPPGSAQYTVASCMYNLVVCFVPTDATSCPKFSTCKSALTAVLGGSSPSFNDICV